MQHQIWERDQDLERKLQRATLQKHGVGSQSKAKDLEKSLFNRPRKRMMPLSGPMR